MPNADPKNYNIVKSSLTSAGVLEREEEIEYATKFLCRSGNSRADISIFSTGTIRVGGGSSPLKQWLTELKESIDKGAPISGVLLPSEIENLPQVLKQRVKDCDEAILWYLQESIKCYKSQSVAGAAFMLGAASEKAIHLLIECFANSMDDEKNRASFLSKMNNKSISRQFVELKKCMSGIKDISFDMEQMIDGSFHFYRLTRNEIGHPKVIPDLIPGVILANIGQFVEYIGRIYDLMDRLKSKTIKV